MKIHFEKSDFHVLQRISSLHFNSTCIIFKKLLYFHKQIKVLKQTTHDLCGNTIKADEIESRFPFRKILQFSG